MNALLPRRIERPGAVIEVFPDGHPRVHMTGVIGDAEVAAWLTPLIADVHHDVTLRRLGELVLDLRGLEYANAALWKCVVAWLKTLREDPRAIYNLRIVSDPSHRWQEVGLAMLRVFGANRLRIDGRDETPLKSTGR